MSLTIDDFAPVQRGGSYPSPIDHIIDAVTDPADFPHPLLKARFWRDGVKYGAIVIDTAEARESLLDVASAEGVIVEYLASTQESRAAAMASWVVGAVQQWTPVRPRTNAASV